MSARPVKVRIGPSPTGAPHVGTAYVSLFNYAFAKKNGGKFVFRLEDTDQKRSYPESEQALYDSLKWLGLTWDEGPDVGGPCGPYRQSERKEIYKEHLQHLLDSGHAYYCTCTNERLADVRKRQQMLKQPTGYDGHCRNRPEAVQSEIDAGAVAVIRLKTPKSGTTTVDDLLRGSIQFENTEVDDQVLMKGDGFPTYHLANVVDDYLMGISHVIRGEEWISSTPKHVLLYDAFGWEKPTFCHLPLLRNLDKSKVSKRKNPVSLDYFKMAGYLPDALLNFLGLMAFSIGDDKEIFSLDEFIENFDPKRISLGGPVFDMQKLLWLNGRYMRERRNNGDLVSYFKSQLFSDEYLGKIIPLIKERVEKSEDFINYADFFFVGDVSVEPSLYAFGDMEKKQNNQLLGELIDSMEAIRPFSAENVEQALKGFCSAEGLKPKFVFMPVRYMVTGKKATPPLFETIAVLGKERVLSRMRKAAERFKKAN